MILEIFKILKKYNIRYARHAVHQFLGEGGLSLPIPEKYRQEIHQGFISDHELEPNESQS
jgi:hypothetical protein